VAPERVVLHVGMHKTGTTYLQNRLGRNRDTLAERGIRYPGGGTGASSPPFAVYDLQGRRPRGHEDTRVAGAWDALVADVMGSVEPTVLISQEALGFCTLRQARTAVQAFGDAQVDIVVTARDLARVLVSMWQEEVKNDRSWTWRAYVDSVKDPDQATVLPALGFWRRADLVRVTDTWSAVSGADRLHVVTVPPRGAGADELVRRLGQVVGFEPSDLPVEPEWSNEMVGAAGTEVLRRVNEELGGRLNQAQHTRAIRRTLVPILVGQTKPEPLTIPDEEFDWVSERSDQAIAHVRSRGFGVVGDLDDLRPRRNAAASSPDAVVDDELLAVAVQSLALMAERYATAWWVKQGRTIEGGDEQGGMASRARGRLFRVKEKVVESAQHNAAASKLVERAVKAEARRVEKANNRRSGA
jgi:hypothetical protein